MFTLENAGFYVGGIVTMYFYSAAISPTIAKVIEWVKGL